MNSVLLLERADALLEAILLSNDKLDRGHGIDHARIVVLHAKRAIDVHDPKLTSEQEIAVILAALLHDADDKKFFDTINYANARLVLTKLQLSNSIISDVIKMIDAVSYSKNKNNNNDQLPPWMLIPRYADRLEATGHIGIYRCLEYSNVLGRPMFNEKTKRCKTVAEINEAVKLFGTKDWEYSTNCMIDHLYEKVLKLVDLTIMSSNSYINSVALRRHQTVIDFLLQFGESNTVDPIAITRNRMADDSV
jgi:uncharacterized protein